MSKGLLVFTEGKEVIGARISKVVLASDELELAYDYKVDNVGYTGTIKATSTDGASWAGEWTDKDQRWKASSGKLEMSGVKAQNRAMFHGTWGHNERADGEEFSFSVELPRSYR
jgi:hypothetical protein